MDSVTIRRAASLALAFALLAVGSEVRGQGLDAPRAADVPATPATTGISLERDGDAHRAAQASGLQPADLHRLRSVGRVAISPDGERVAFSISDPEGDGRPSSSLWIHDLSSDERTRVSSGVSDLAWSPEGDRLAFIGSLEERSGLIVVSPTGEDPTFLAPTRWTNRPLPSTGSRLSWSPDGSRIAYVSATPPPEGEAPSTDPLVITRYLYKPTASTGDTRLADHRRLHLHVADVESGEARQLTSGRFDEHSVDWAPEGEEILFVSNREPEPDRFFNYDIFAIRADDGSVRRLTATESAEYNPVWSPDGQRVAYQGTHRGLTSSETTMEDTHVWVMDADGSDRRDVGAAIDNRQSAPGWSPDGASLYTVVDERGSEHLHRLSADGSGTEEVLGDRGEVGAWSMAGSGRLAYAFTGPEGPADLHLRDGDGAERRLTRLNEDLLSERGIAPVEAFTFRGVDGLEVEAFLTYPLGRGADTRHPMIVMIKGGPHSQQGPAFNAKAQIYAARGWAVLMVNYRGSVGYGQSFADAIFRDQNGREAQDVLYGTQAAMRRNPWIDRDRIGIEGGSYGGQLTNWLITQTDLYAAAVPIAGISNLVSFNYMAYYHDYLAVEYGAWPHQGDVMDMLWERSPLRFVAQVRTPVMLVHGENDNDVPIAEAEQYYIALRDVGVEAVLVRYPREGHGIRETAHEVDLVERSIDWYRRHFGAG